MPIASLLSQDKIDALVERTMKGGAEIVGLMKVGSAFQAPATATMEMVEAIILDQGRLIPCSVLLEGEYGIQNTFCGTIVKLGDGGVQQIYEVQVSDDEKAKIKAAADATKELVGMIEG
jgi:malate dehydrogenase